MKNVYIFVVVLIFCAFQLFSQQTSIPYRITTIKQYTNNEYMGESRLQYNENGALIAVKYYNILGMVLNEVTYSYNENGRLIKRTNPCSSCGEGVAYRTYDYSSEGYLIKVSKYDLSNQLKEYYTIQYENGKIKTYKIYDKANVLIKKGVRSFNASGTILTDAMTAIEGNEISRIETGYSQDGLVIEIALFKNGLLALTTVFEYSVENIPIRIHMTASGNEQTIRSDITSENRNSMTNIFDLNVQWELD